MIKAISTEVPYLIKDVNSGAVLNTDKAALLARKQKIEHAKRITSLETKVESLMDDINIIKKLLIELNNGMK